MEPIDGPVPMPIGGWPSLVIFGISLSDDPEKVFYETASLSRRWRLGVSASCQGVEVIAFPHQTVDEIARTWLRLKKDLAAEKPNVTKLPDRWTASRKSDVLTRIQSGTITRQQASESYAISEEELSSWERGFGREGLGGLKATRLREGS
jgi:hypothetical protein